MTPHGADGCVDGYGGEYAVQVLMNADTSSAYWSIDSDFDPCALTCAREYVEAVTTGEYPFDPECVRIVRLVPIGTNQ